MTSRRFEWKQTFWTGVYIHKSLRVSGYKQCCGSMTFWCGSGSADPCLWLMDPDPDPAIFVIDLKRHQQKTSFSAYHFLKIHLHHKTGKGFSYYFCLMIEGSRRPKHMVTKCKSINRFSDLPNAILFPSSRDLFRYWYRLHKMISQ